MQVIVFIVLISSSLRLSPTSLRLDWGADSQAFTKDQRLFDPNSFVA
jgi:hypothetical protein